MGIASSSAPFWKGPESSESITLIRDRVLTYRICATKKRFTIWRITEIKDTAFGWTPLAWAARYGQVEVVRLLLDKGANVNTRDKHKSTPLQNAVQSGNLETMRLLLDKSENVDERNKSGSTPLHKAAENEWKFGDGQIVVR